MSEPGTFDPSMLQYGHTLKVEAVAKQMYCSLFPGPNHWPEIVNAGYWKAAARWHLQETAELVKTKDDALRRVLKYLRSPEDESAEYIERLLEGALK